MLAGAYGASPATVTMTAQRPLTFRAQADSAPVTVLPLARTHYQRYTVCCDTAALAPPAGRSRPG